MTTFVGGKSGAGVWQRIVNQIPRCEVFVSGFLGRCGVMRRIALPAVAIGLDLDSEVISEWQDALPLSNAGDSTNVVLSCEDTLTWLREAWQGKRFAPWCGRGGRWQSGADVVLYLDPPYMLGTRGGRMYYRHELSDDQHRQLVEIVAALPCRVLLNHPRCELYDAALGDWRRIEYRAMTRGGKLMEDCLWANYPEPDELQDYRFVGRNKRQRERIRRRCRNWVASLNRMGPHERGAVLSAVAAEFGGR